MSKFLSLIKAMGFGTAADAAVHVGISTDTQPRLQIDAGGKHTWGAGSTTPGDTTLYRSAADTLKTDDAFIATGGLTVKTTEIDTASATSGQALVFNGTKFAPGNATPGVLDTLTDVVIATATTGQVLKYDGTNWVNATLVSGVSVSDAAPSSPTQGQLWFESDTGLTYIYYDSFWVEVGAGSSYDPITNTIQAKGDLIVGTGSQALTRLTVGTDTQRLVANSSTVTGVSWAGDSTNTVIDTKGDLLVGATNDVVAKLPVGTNNQMLVANPNATNGISWTDQPSNFRNVLINGDFRINQRSFTSITTNTSYGFDRWRLALVGDGTTTWTPVAFTPGNAIPGHEPINYSRIVTTGQTVTNTVSRLVQHIEDVRTFAGRTVTVSFWAKCASGTPSIAVDFTQSNGSTATNVNGAKVAISTSWARYSITINIPSISSVTGSSHYLALSLWVSAGSVFDARTGSLGIQSNTFDIWGVQLEAGSQPTPFEQRPIGTELALCQRYYYRRGGGAGGVVSDIYLSGYQPASTNIIFSHFHPVEMRATPSLAQKVGVWALINTPSQPIIGSPSIYGYFIYITVNSGIGNTNQSAAYTNGSSNYLEFSAEL